MKIWLSGAGPKQRWIVAAACKNFIATRVYVTTIVAKEACLHSTQVTDSTV